MLLVIGTHDDKVHTLSYDEEKATISHLKTTTLESQPSWILPSSHHPGLLYINSWDNAKLFVVRLRANGMLEVLASTPSGGAGPTHFTMAADGSALVVANYIGGSISRIPIKKDGLFAGSAPSLLAFDWTPPAAVNVRQDASHPHHIIPFGDEEYWVPDLGGDHIWYVRWRDGWEVVGGIVSEGGTGPRHGVIHPDGSHLYIVNELSSTLSTFDLSTSPPTLLTSCPSTLPSTIAMTPHHLRGGPYETIACAIILLTSPTGQHRLVVSNRDIPASLSPAGDMLAEFQIDGYTPSSPTFIFGLGSHPRGVQVDPEGKQVAVLSRGGGGLTLFGVGEELSIINGVEGWGGDVMDRPVCAAWVNEGGLE